MDSKSKNKVHLKYHDIVTDTDKSSGFQNDSAFQYKVDATHFEEHVKQLYDINVVFTFDDGGSSFYSYAAPILEKYGLRGIFFISTQYIDTPGFLTIDQVRELKERGHVIVGHSHTHLSNIASLSIEGITREWNDSKNILEEIINDKVKKASIPNGFSSKKVIQSAQNAGLEILYTSEPTTKVRMENGIKLIGRYIVHQSMSDMDVIRLATDRKLQRKKYNCMAGAQCYQSPTW